MSSNGNGYSHNGNGNGKPWSKKQAWKNVLKESTGLGVAEFASGAVSLGVVAVADDIAPDLLKHASKVVGKIVEPYLLTPAEWVMNNACKLEECKPDKTKNRSERAEDLAHTGILFTAAFATSLVAKLAARKGMNWVMGLESKPVPKTGNWFKDKVLYKFLDMHDWSVVKWDEGVHIGSIVLVNTALAKPADELIKNSSTLLQKTMGWSKEKADRVSSMGVIWEIPNAAGWAAGVGRIYHHHMHEQRPR